MRYISLFHVCNAYLYYRSIQIKQDSCGERGREEGRGEGGREGGRVGDFSSALEKRINRWSECKYEDLLCVCHLP